ncbi:hypothetical protein QYM36_017818, partial [Artemia franciscana]
MTEIVRKIERKLILKKDDEDELIFESLTVGNSENEYTDEEKCVNIPKVKRKKLKSTKARNATRKNKEATEPKIKSTVIEERARSKRKFRKRKRVAGHVLNSKKEVFINKKLQKAGQRIKWIMKTSMRYLGIGLVKLLSIPVYVDNHKQY